MLGTSKSVWGFDPRSVPGCQLWLDGADTSSMTFSSGAITQWRDKSGSSNHFTPTSGTPTSISDNGRNVVNFTSGAIMTSTNQITFTTSSAFFIVSRLNSLPVADIGMILGFTNITDGDVSIRYYGNKILGGTSGSGNFGDLANGTYYVNGTFNPSFGSSTYLNTYSLIGTVAPQFGGTSFLTLSSAFMSRFFIGNIAEFLYYPGGVTSSQSQQIEGYLAWKWGLTTLPSTHPFSSIRPHLRTFQPSDVPGCQLWLDAADTSSMTLSGSNVTQWRDKSGNSNNATQSTTANQPTSGTITQNGLNVLNLTNKTMTYPVISLSTMTIFCVYRQLDFAGYRTPLSVGAFAFFYADGGNVGIGRLGVTGEVSANYSTYGITSDNYTIYGATVSISGSTTTNMYFNATNVASNTVNSSGGIVRYEIGRSELTSTGYIAEVLIYNSVLTTSQRQQVEGYLAHKWGLTLPAPTVHPYDKYPPASLHAVVIPTSSVRIINLDSGSGGPTSGSFTMNSIVGGGTGTFTNSDVFLSDDRWGMAQCFDGRQSGYDLYMTQNPNFMELVFPRELMVTKIFLVPRNQQDAFPSSLTLKANGTLVGTYTSTTVSQALGMGISYSGTGYYIQPAAKGTTWRFDFTSTPVSFGEIEFWGYLPT